MSTPSGIPKHHMTGSIIVAKLFTVLIRHVWKNSMSTVRGTVAHGF
jgi:hypothetical protein